MKFRKWTLEEQAHFLKRTGELLSRGYPLAEAIESLTFHMNEKRRIEIIDGISDLKEGHPFNKVLFKLRFNPTLIGFVYFAEQHGGLPSAFLDGSKMMLKRNQDLAKLKKLLYYPLFLMIITAFLFGFVEKILLPRFSTLFQNMRLKPNIFMKVIYFSADLIPLILFLLLLISIGLVVYYLYRYRTFTPMKKKTLLSKIPVFGPFYKLLTTHYFSIQLSYLLAGGLSINESLTVFEKHVKLPFDQQIGQEIKQLLSTGLTFENIIKKFSFFERELSNIVKHGQENGKLEQELLFFSKHCLERFEEKTERSLKIIQPLLYSIIGILIISMYLAILLPMFHLLDGL